MYANTLELYVVGYREGRDEDMKKFVPEYRILAKYGGAVPNTIVPIPEITNSNPVYPNK